MAVTIDAPAKLNLLLEVLRRRDDGYHEIDTVMQTVSLCDRITLEGADELTLEVEGDAPADSSNLAWRAAEALGAAVRIRLEKRIPSGFGFSSRATISKNCGMSGIQLSTPMVIYTRSKVRLY